MSSGVRCLPAFSCSPVVYMTPAAVTRSLASTRDISEANRNDTAIQTHWGATLTINDSLSVTAVSHPGPSAQGTRRDDFEIIQS